ncbi:MAG: hypothetical protein H6702_22335 [Myxococcales bacterium]|nr:hypothetical protein [Myxococcales bacterium]
MSEGLWPFRFGALAVDPMPAWSRAVHVRKHLLARTEAWWEITVADRPTLLAHAAAFEAAGFPCGGAARPERLPPALEARARDLNDGHYEPVYRLALEHFAERRVEVEPQPPSDFILFDHAQGLVVVVSEARPGRPWVVKTAYRPDIPSGAGGRGRARALVRKQRRAASVGMMCDSTTGGVR